MNVPMSWGPWGLLFPTRSFNGEDEVFNLICTYPMDSFQDITQHMFCNLTKVPHLSWPPWNLLLQFGASYWARWFIILQIYMYNIIHINQRWAICWWHINCLLQNMLLKIWLTRNLPHNHGNPQDSQCQWEVDFGEVAS